ncbi:4-dihydrotrisporin dehydrogenase [Backusella circina FSU 941]|nr:4-dihydrotrisporin dehydrogenase [Backusella circina FSU 941]
MTVTYVITGVSRGLGLEYIKQLSQRDDVIVFGCARNPQSSEKLMALVDNKKIFAVKLDTTSSESIQDAVDEVIKHSPNGIDILVNNAGIMDNMQDTVLSTSKSEYLRVFETNVCGVNDVTLAFLPLLRKSSAEVKKIINVSSRLGSIGLSTTGGIEGLFGSAYCVSKAGLNMMTKMFSNALANESFIVMSIHPGWVKTDLGTDRANIYPEDSVRGQLSVIDNLTPKDNGSSIAYDGQPLEW